MSQDPFLVLAQRSRRNILDRLRAGEASVNSLAEQLAMPQPSVSKHLKVLREAGFVSGRTEAQQRIYRLEPHSMQAVDAWLEPFRDLWNKHLDSLEGHLERMED